MKSKHVSNCKLFRLKTRLNVVLSNQIRRHSSSYRNGRINFGLRFLDHLKKTQSGPWICFASLQNFKLLILPSKSGSKASFQGHQTFAQSTNINTVANILIHLHSSPNRQTRKNQNLIIIKLIGSLSFKQNKKFQRKPFLFCVSQFLNNPQRIRHSYFLPLGCFQAHKLCSFSTKIPISFKTATCLERCLLLSLIPTNSLWFLFLM